MKVLIAVINALMILISTSVIADYQDSVDQKGCWDALSTREGQCLYQVSGKMKDGRAIVKYGNKCEHRIYVRFCNERNNGSWDCGSDGIRGGRTKIWSTGNATGRTNAKAVGSAKPSQDWNCTDLHSNWHEPK
jgi:hypothetical protein